MLDASNRQAQKHGKWPVRRRRIYRERRKGWILALSSTKTYDETVTDLGGEYELWLTEKKIVFAIPPTGGVAKRRERFAVVKAVALQMQIWNGRACVLSCRGNDVAG
ncbi:hypothetical protein cyc_04276 [Cyclospora cayetanensis]|uniref:Uncharacterized protein n=1 Tax=Cyclospora cayetanensis TaxID=88456 RepID=A0A1D3D0R8_9EIME|nr:hypothetical protein cyc_04276 [Cyclospora cayetanensis]